MTRLRFIVALSAGIALAAIAGAQPAAQAPKIGKPRPAPATPPNLPPLPPAHFDGSLVIGGEDVNARKIESRLAVDVRVNGTGPYRFVVDSGADTSVIGVRIARDLKLPLATPAILNSMTARNIVDRVQVAELAVGSNRIGNLQLPALQENALGGHGLIGIDALTQQRLMMDFEKRLIKVEDARKPLKYRPGDIIITAKRRRGQLILTRVNAGGVPLDAVIDTGSELTIGNSALRNKLLRRGRHKIGIVEATGVTGVTVKLQMMLVDEIKLGPVLIQNVPIAFADVPPFALFGLADEPALLLGTDVLETFRRVSLDFKARKVRFQLRKCESQGITLRTTTSGHFSRLSPSGSVEACAG